MRKVIMTSLFLAGMAVMVSCTYKTHPQTGGLPPGQAKKITGSKSAKPYAPGQQKKQ